MARPAALLPPARLASRPSPAAARTSRRAGCPSLPASCRPRLAAFPPPSCCLVPGEQSAGLRGPGSGTRACSAAAASSSPLARLRATSAPGTCETRRRPRPCAANPPLVGTFPNSRTAGRRPLGSLRQGERRPGDLGGAARPARQAPPVEAGAVCWAETEAAAPAAAGADGARAVAARTGDARTVRDLVEGLLAADSDLRHQNSPGPVVDPATYRAVFAALESTREWACLDWWETRASRTALENVEATPAKILLGDDIRSVRGTIPQKQYARDLHSEAGRRRLQASLVAMVRGGFLNTATMNYAFAGLSKRNDGLAFALELGRELDAEARRLNDDRLAATYRAAARGALVVAVAASGLPERARAMIDKSVSEGFPPPVDVYGHYFLSLKTSARNADLVYQVFRDHLADRSTPATPFVCHSMMEKFLEDPARMDEIIAYMRRWDVRPTSRTYGMIIRTALRAGDERLALNALRELQSRHARGTVTARPDAYGLVAHLYATEYRNRRAALRVLDEVRRPGGICQPDAETYLPALHAWACVTPVDMSAAEDVVEEMRARGLRPTGAHYAKLVTGYGVFLGDLEEAERVVAERLHRGGAGGDPPVHPERAWQALAAAYAHHRDLPAAARTYRAAAGRAAADGSVARPGLVGNYVIAACAAADPPDLSAAAEIFDGMQPRPAPRVPARNSDTYLAMLGAHFRSATFGADPGGVANARLLHGEMARKFGADTKGLRAALDRLLRAAEAGDDGEVRLWLRRHARRILNVDSAV